MAGAECSSHFLYMLKIKNTPLEVYFKNINIML